MPNQTKAVFDTTASIYDNDRSLLIPGCETFYRWAIDLIPDGTRRIVELGAGSGLLTVLVRERFPEAKIHLMDFSGAMLDCARRRLGESPNITYEEADYVVAPLANDLDAVVSSLSIHHLEDSDKQVVFRKVYEALAPGGVFINAEQVAGPNADLEERYQKLWLEQVRKAGASQAQIDGALYRMREDRCASVEDQLNWLREAGFSDADCWYKENRFAVFAGTRA